MTRRGPGCDEPDAELQIILSDADYGRGALEVLDKLVSFAPLLVSDHASLGPWPRLHGPHAASE